MTHEGTRIFPTKVSIGIERHSWRKGELAFLDKGGVSGAGMSVLCDGGALLLAAMEATAIEPARKDALD